MPKEERAKALFFCVDMTSLNPFDSLSPRTGVSDGDFYYPHLPLLIRPNSNPAFEAPKNMQRRGQGETWLKQTDPDFFFLSLLALFVPAHSVSLHPRFHNATSALLGHCRARYQRALPFNSHVEILHQHVTYTILICMRHAQLSDVMGDPGPIDSWTMTAGEGCVKRKMPSIHRRRRT